MEQSPNSRTQIDPFQTTDFRIVLSGAGHFSTLLPQYAKLLRAELNAPVVVCLANAGNINDSLASSFWSK